MIIKLHVIAAFFSLALLLIRGGMQLSGKNWRAVKLLKILPHLADTLLLVSGLTILYLWQFYLPLWLVGKLGLLVCYIIFAAKYFGRKTATPNPLYFFLALISFTAALLLAYFH